MNRPIAECFGDRVNVPAYVALTRRGDMSRQGATLLGLTEH